MPTYLSSASSELCSETSERSLAWVLVSNLQLVRKFLLQRVLIMDGPRWEVAPFSRSEGGRADVHQHPSPTTW